MQMQPSQVIEGYVLLKDVHGKSGRPIIKKNTVLTEIHITILQKFLIESVDVSSERVDGKEDKTEQEKKDEQEPPIIKNKVKAESIETNSFREHYLQVVSGFRHELNQWNNSMPIDILKIRQLIIPLLERVDELDVEIFSLHHYARAEDYIYHHSVAVSIISAYVAKEMGYKKGEGLQIGIAGLLCDSGMTRVDPAIIKSVGPLTNKQLRDIKNHPTYSYRMVENLPAISQTAKQAILQHHERMDGSGYPTGIAKEKINDYARILAVSDTYHAMTSERFYKKKQSPFKVIDELYKEQFTRLDPRVVHVFTLSLTKRSLGKMVTLSNGVTGEIIFIDDDYPTRPLVKLDTTKEIISLRKNPELHIKEFIQV